MTDRPNPPPKRRGTLIAGAVLAVAAAAYGTGTKIAVETQEQPIGFATAVYGPDEPKEVNAVIYKGRVEETEVTYDKEGHADLPEWKAELGPLPPWVIPAAPTMGWDTTFFREIANRSRPLRYCADPRRAFDQQHGTQTAAIGIRAIQACLTNRSTFSRP